MPPARPAAEAEPDPLPGADLDLQDAKVVIDLFQQAAEASLNTPGRAGSVVDLPLRGQLVASGDLHDHGLNFLRLLRLARLKESPDHHIILHEMIHGPHLVNGCDLSVRTLARAAALKLTCPAQVHLLLANHDLAQLGGEGIIKDGVSVVRAFDAGVEYLYGDQSEAVNEAIGQFIRSFILAVRCANGIFCCHSLPSPRHLPDFDTSVIDRVPTEADLKHHGHAYRMVWGRNHTQELADALADAWSCRLFVMGHQPAEMGYELEGDSMIVLASDHDHGTAIPISLDREHSRDALVENVLPLAGVSL